MIDKEQEKDKGEHIRQPSKQEILEHNGKKKSRNLLALQEKLIGQKYRPYCCGHLDT